MNARDHRLEETAFPSDSHRSVGPDGSNKWPYSPGMSLRDYFAGQALTGLIASPDFLSPSGLFTGGGADVMAKAAYMLADAMLAERSK